MYIYIVTYQSFLYILSMRIEQKSIICYYVFLIKLYVNFLDPIVC